MLLTLDVGNTNTVLGVFRGIELVANWRLTTARDQTVDEYGILTRDLFTLANLEPHEIRGVIISSVVPPLNSTLAGMAERYFTQRRSSSNPASRPACRSITIIRRRSARTASSTASLHSPNTAARASSWISARRLISTLSPNAANISAACSAPGIGISADALFRRAARLLRVEIHDPGKIIGTNTAESMQSGLFYGYTDMVDGILERMKEVLGAKTRVIATGGQAR